MTLCSIWRWSIRPCARTVWASLDILGRHLVPLERLSSMSAIWLPESFMMWRFVYVPFIQLWQGSWFFHMWARIFRHSGTGSLSEDPGSWPNNSWPIWCLCNLWLYWLLDLTSMFQLDGWCILGSRLATIFSAPPTDHPAEEVQSGVRGKFPPVPDWSHWSSIVIWNVRFKFSI